MAAASLKSIFVLNDLLYFFKISNFEGLRAYIGLALSKLLSSRPAIEMGWTFISLRLLKLQMPVQILANVYLF